MSSIHGTAILLHLKRITALRDYEGSWTIRRSLLSSVDWPILKDCLLSSDISELNRLGVSQKMRRFRVGSLP